MDFLSTKTSLRKDSGTHLEKNWPSKDGFFGDFCCGDHDLRQQIDMRHQIQPLRKEFLKHPYYELCFQIPNLLMAQKSGETVEIEKKFENNGILAISTGEFFHQQ